MGHLRNTRIWGLALVAVFAFSALAAANASATQPVAEGFPATFSGVGGAGKLETTGPTIRTINCTGNTSSGEINSANTVKGVKVTFTGCTTTGPFGVELSCKSSGAAAGVIVTNVLKGKLVYLIAGSSRAGIDLEPESGTTFASITCTKTIIFEIKENLTVTGSVIGEITPVNTSATKFTLAFKQKEPGMQEFESYLNPSGCSPVTDVLTTVGSGAESFTSQSAVEGTEAITTSKTIKINSSKCS